MDPVVLFRRGGYEDELRLEIPAFEKHFPSVGAVNKIGKGKLVIGRFALRPFYKEVEMAIVGQGSSVLNPYNHYRWTNEMTRWYESLAEFTPRTWFHTSEVDIDGPFFVKGNTNSRKSHWETHCYAQDREELATVAKRLHEDPMIGGQGLAIREFVPLRNLGTHPESGAPISEEYRFFVCDHTVLGGGFYWSDQLQVIGEGADLDAKHVPAEFLERIIAAVPGSIRFYVVDVARREDDEWTLVEVNEPSMAGMAGCDPQEIYANLSKVLLEEAKPRRRRRVPVKKTPGPIPKTAPKQGKSSTSKAGKPTAKKAKPAAKKAASAPASKKSQNKSAVPDAKEQMLEAAQALKDVTASEPDGEDPEPSDAPDTEQNAALSELIEQFKQGHLDEK